MRLPGDSRQLMAMVYPQIVSTDLDVLFCKIWVPSLKHGV